MENQALKDGVMCAILNHADKLHCWSESRYTILVDGLLFELSVTKIYKIEKYFNMLSDRVFTGKYKYQCSVGEEEVELTKEEFESVLAEGKKKREIKLFNKLEQLCKNN